MKSELSLMEQEKQYYAEMNRLHKLTGKTCDGYGCGFPCAQRCPGFGTDYCKWGINKTHIMVIRKNSTTGIFETDYLPLEFEEREKLKELKKLSNMIGISGDDMFKATLQKKLDYLLDYYDFCECVNGSYQCCPVISNKDVKKGRPYSNSKDFYQLLESRSIAYCLSKKYKECRENPSIVAYSSRHIGWNSMHFSLNHDLSIAYNTNFGYGYANYFTAKLKYKDIDILPYSMWVNYYNANIFQILRYTRAYCISNSEWKNALDFGRDVCNSLVQNPKGFANEWLIGEVRKMVDGLRRIFNNRDTVIAVNESNGSGRELKTKEEILLYKGEKISGALSFLGKIKEIEKLNVSMDSFITAILNMNRQIVPELLVGINECKEKLAELTLERNELLEKIKPIKDFIDNHTNECVVNFICDTTYTAIQEAKKIMSEISYLFKETNEQLMDLKEKESMIYERINHMEHVTKTLSSYVETIKSFMKSHPSSRKSS